MQNQSKIATVNKCHSEILQSIDKHTLINAYFGGSNLLADYLNDYSSEGINSFIGEFIDTHWGKPYMQEYSYTASEIINEPDLIIQGTSVEFLQALGRIIGQDDCETIFRNSKMSFKGDNSFYIYANPWSNSCCNYYIIRADSFQEAYSDLIDTFENDFIIENPEDVLEDAIYNDNGEPVNIDNLMFLGEIKLTE